MRRNGRDLNEEGYRKLIVAPFACVLGCPFLVEVCSSVLNAGFVFECIAGGVVFLGREEKEMQRFTDF